VLAEIVEFDPNSIRGDIEFRGEPAKVGADSGVEEQPHEDLHPHAGGDYPAETILGHYYPHSIVQLSYTVSIEALSSRKENPVRIRTQPPIHGGENMISSSYDWTLDWMAREYVRPDSVTKRTNGQCSKVRPPRIEGNPRVMDRIAGLREELSPIPLYEGKLSFGHPLEQVKTAGLKSWGRWPGFTDPQSGRLLQVDATFFRP